MKARKILKRILFTVIGIFLFLSLVIYFALYYGTPCFAVKDDIQAFLNKNYNKKFILTDIEKDYSPDLFHQFVGYKITAEDSSGINIDNIYITSQQGDWKFYRGSDIADEYSKAQQEKLRPHKSQ